MHLRARVCSGSLSVHMQNNEMKYHSAILREHDNLSIPVPWVNDHAIVAYSKNGYQHKTWILPPGFTTYKEFNVHQITPKGKIFKEKIEVSRKNRLSISIATDVLLLIEPIKE